MNKNLLDQIKKIIGHEVYCSNSVDDTCVCDCGTLKLTEQILKAVGKYTLEEREKKQESGWIGE